ncbi:MAG TPA: hypothetical protein VEP50_15160 [bacterium]|nr:hypothetical protein [bacterium]
MLRERRNPSRLGRQRRDEFQQSLQRLRELGMPDWAVQCYGRAARIAGQLPHDVVCRVAVWTANRMLGVNAAGDQPGSTGRSAPSSDRSRVELTFPPTGARKKSRTH